MLNSIFSKMPRRLRRWVLYSQIYYSLELPDEAVRDFAYDSLAFATNVDDQHSLVEIIDAKTIGDFQDAMSRYGEALAARSGVTQATAIRKWC